MADNRDGSDPDGVRVHSSPVSVERDVSPESVTESVILTDSIPESGVKSITYTFSRRKRFSLARAKPFRAPCISDPLTLD